MVNNSTAQMLAIENRIKILNARGPQNKNIISKLERKKRQLERNAD